jgi:hypothetical protein
MNISKETIKTILRRLNRKGYIKTFQGEKNKYYPILINGYPTLQGEVNISKTDLIRNIFHTVPDPQKPSTRPSRDPLIGSSISPVTQEQSNIQKTVPNPPETFSRPSSGILYNNKEDKELTNRESQVLEKPDTITKFEKYNLNAYMPTPRIPTTPTKFTTGIIRAESSETACSDNKMIFLAAKLDNGFLDDDIFWES